MKGGMDGKCRQEEEEEDPQAQVQEAKGKDASPKEKEGTLRVFPGSAGSRPIISHP
jgi:hypothetical protein